MTDFWQMIFIFAQHLFIFNKFVVLFAFEAGSPCLHYAAPSRSLQTVCIKSTSVTVQTLNFPRMQTGLCLSLLHFFIFKTDVPLFHFCVKRKMKKRT